MNWKPRILNDGHSSYDVLGGYYNEDRGRIDPPDDEPQYEECPICHGDGGYCEAGEWERCFNCRGQGVIDDRAT